jgi:phage gp36-like protein
MPYLLAADLDTHIYAEIRDEITREDAARVTSAIKEAVSEAKSYLSRFDLVALFGTEVPLAAPTVDDEHLKSIIKSIAVWRLVRLANPNISIAMARTNYEDAIKWLMAVQSGKADPEGWPYKADNPDTPFNEGALVDWSSNTKRGNHF